MSDSSNEEKVKGYLGEVFEQTAAHDEMKEEAAAAIAGFVRRVAGGKDATPEELLILPEMAKVLLDYSL